MPVSLRPETQRAIVTDFLRYEAGYHVNQIAFDLAPLEKIRVLFLLCQAIDARLVPQTARPFWRLSTISLDEVHCISHYASACHFLKFDFDIEKAAQQALEQKVHMLSTEAGDFFLFQIAVQTVASIIQIMGPALSSSDQSVLKKIWEALPTTPIKMTLHKRAEFFKTLTALLRKLIESNAPPHPFLLEVLVSLGAAIDPPNRYEWLLEKALEKGWWATADYLYQLGASLVLNEKKYSLFDAFMFPSEIARPRIQPIMAWLFAHQAPFDVNQGQRGSGVLIRAIESRQLPLAERLLAAGADANSERYGRPSLFVAVDCDALEFVARLLDEGADPNQSYLGQTFLSFLTGFAQRISWYSEKKRQYCTQLIARLTAMGAKCVEAPPSDPWNKREARSEFLDIVASNNVALVQTWVTDSSRAEHPDQNPKYWGIPWPSMFLYAISKGQLEMVQLFWRIKQSRLTENDAVLAIPAAILSGNQAVLAFLLHEKIGRLDYPYHETQHALDEDPGYLPLALAFKHKQYEMAQLLVEYGVPLEPDRLSEWLTQAARDNATGVIAALIARHVEVDCENGKGETPLRIAASLGHLEMVRVLVTEGRADIQARNMECKNALELAKHAKVMRYLTQELPAPPPYSLLDKAKDIFGKSEKSSTRPLTFAEKLRKKLLSLYAKILLWVKHLQERFRETLHNQILALAERLHTSLTLRRLPPTVRHGVILPPPPPVYTPSVVAHSYGQDIHAAMREGNLDAMQSMLTQNAKLVNVLHSSSHLPPIYHVMLLKFEKPQIQEAMVALLLQHEPIDSPNFKIRDYGYHETVLEAVSKPERENLRALFEKRGVVFSPPPNQQRAKPA